jgi:hypothetical protein
MFIITAKADLIKPNNDIEPYQVIKIQLRSLKQNDNPRKDSGIIPMVMVQQIFKRSLMEQTHWIRVVFLPAAARAQVEQVAGDRQRSRSLLKILEMSQQLMRQ